MKTTLLVFAGVAALCFSSCNSNSQDKKVQEIIANELSKSAISLDENDAGKTGSFSVDAQNFNGKTSTQYFGDKIKDQFSVLCQQDDPFALLQITFANEAEAKGNPKPADGFYSMEPGEAHVAVSGTDLGDKEFATKEKSTGSITVSDHQIILKDLQIFNQYWASKTINATLNY